MKLIPLDAILAEIDKRIKTCLNQREEMIIADCETLVGDATARAGELQCLRDSINSLEVKEVDLEKEIENLIEKEKAFVTGNREVKYYNGDSFNHIYELEFIAKHFFELGLKAQKGE